MSSTASPRITEPQTTRTFWLLGNQAGCLDLVVRNMIFFSRAARTVSTVLHGDINHPQCFKQHTELISTDIRLFHGLYAVLCEDGEYSDHVWGKIP
jgi:hypothetical protein